MSQYVHKRSQNKGCTAWTSGWTSTVVRMQQHEIRGGLEYFAIMCFSMCPYFYWRVSVWQKKRNSNILTSISSTDTSVFHRLLLLNDHLGSQKAKSLVHNHGLSFFFVPAYVLAFRQGTEEYMYMYIIFLSVKKKQLHTWDTSTFPARNSEVAYLPLPIKGYFAMKVTVMFWHVTDTLLPLPQLRWLFSLKQ